ncbi:alpha-D-ribose 1-methylphosphonate 5-triphosphate diphosphatase [Acetomicrobium sp. S15 = DSM 107314]|uniref:alpha-D-ribose 1-methylphosphonate 5-triphosphate diphosphatase n=1 Tax=Acetomicrobium sp. S15 = DSM 107314 TaxID=2529858 RepID=UPI0018E17DA3|nr:alpha-D-ribose 1-methylphosphonate 5-triphosphate diphosphatase [Acetomicrobium sp. S15 = DSM 107314]
MHKLMIDGANIVLPNGMLEEGYLRIEDGIIIDVGAGRPSPEKGISYIDASGLYILPGLIDIHSDAVEKEVQPRPNVTIPIPSSCRELERKLAAVGITTIFHSLSFSGGEGIRSNALAAECARFIRRRADQEHLIRNLVHLRYEIGNTKALELIYELLEEGACDLVSFMDHTPGQGQYRDVSQYHHYIKKTFWLEDKDCQRLIEEKIQARQRVDFRALSNLARSAKDAGIPLASHDDDSPERVEVASAMGVDVMEFPMNLETAKYARNLGLHVCVGAPNLLQGRSHNGNLSAQVAVEDGAADILCSDYYPPALLKGIFKLADNGMDISRAVNLASLNPAIALGLDDEIGSLEVGKKADFILVRLEENDPLVITTVTEGKIVLTYNYHDPSHLEGVLASEKEAIAQ